MMKFGIISLGNHARNRAMPAIVGAGHVISDVLSRNPEKAREAGRKYSARAHTDLDSFLASDFDAAYISSPNFLHYEHAKRALEAGKHVLLEKQMTLDSGEAATLVRLAAERRLKLAVGFHLRFHPAVADMRELIRSGELGDITSITGMWAYNTLNRQYDQDSIWWQEDAKAGGGSVMGTGVHVIDSLNFVLGKQPVSVSGIRLPEGRRIELFEHITMRYGGVAGIAVSSRCISGSSNSMTVYGSNGTAEARGLFSTSVDASLYRDGRKVRDYSGGNMYEVEIDGFATLVEGGESSIALGSDGELVVRIVNAAEKSDREGVIVSI